MCLKLVYRCPNGPNISHEVPHYHYNRRCAAILENVRGATLELPHAELLTEKDSTYLISDS